MLLGPQFISLVYRLQVTSSSLQVTSYRLQVYKLQVTVYRLTGYRLQVTGLQVTSYSLQVTSYRLQVTVDKLQVTVDRLQVKFTAYSVQVTAYSLKVTGYSTRFTGYSLQVCRLQFTGYSLRQVEIHNEQKLKERLRLSIEKIISTIVPTQVAAARPKKGTAQCFRLVNAYFYQLELVRLCIIGSECNLCIAYRGALCHLTEYHYHINIIFKDYAIFLRTAPYF